MVQKVAGRARARVWLCCLTAAAAFLYIATKSSPLYPLNDWVDSNIYFTIGKGMMRGLVPYVDLYDQKGPMVFLVYGLASLISSKSFLGVYLVEIITLTLFLYASYRIVALYEDKNVAFVIPILAAGVVSSLSFSHGGSAEELTLPLFAFSLYDALRYAKMQYPKPPSLWMIARNGALAGILLLTKFNLLAFHFAWMAVMAIALMVAREWKRAILSCVVFLGAMAAVSAPWLVYFGLNGALGDFFTYYFYNNLFGYSYLEEPLLINMVLAVIKSTLAFFARNYGYTLLIALGVLYLTLAKARRATSLEKIFVWATLVLLDFAIYCGGQGYRYYGIVLACYAALGAIPILRWANRVVFTRLGRWLRVALPAVALAALLLTYIATDNRYMIGMEKTETPQGRFAEQMRQIKGEDDISLFCYCFPDAGFYLAADVTPDCRFFSTSNTGLSEIAEGQTAYMEARKAEFVVTRNRELETPYYAKIDQMSFWYEDYDDIYRLYRRADEGDNG